MLNAAAVAYMLEHGVPETVTATLLAHERRSFADEAAWTRTWRPSASAPGSDGG